MTYEEYEKNFESIDVIPILELLPYEIKTKHDKYQLIMIHGVVIGYAINHYADGLGC